MRVGFPRLGPKTRQMTDQWHTPTEPSRMARVYAQVRAAAAEVDRGAPVTQISSWLDPQYRPEWMSDDQWQQFTWWMRGEAVPTDAELWRALQLEGRVSDPGGPDRGSYWAYRTVDGTFVGAENVRNWSQLIQQYAPDPDLVMDVGL